MERIFNIAFSKGAVCLESYFIKSFKKNLIKLFFVFFFSVGVLLWVARLHRITITKLKYDSIKRQKIK